MIKISTKYQRLVGEHVKINNKTGDVVLKDPHTLETLHELRKLKETYDRSKTIKEENPDDKDRVKRTLTDS